MSVPSESLIKWVLFCLMAASVPVLYFMFVVGGFLPLIAIVYLCFTGVWGFKLFNAVHLLIYVPLFYLIARAVARHISRLSTRRMAVFFFGIALSLIVIAFLPVYGIGHHESQTVNLYRLFRDGHF